VTEGEKIPFPRFQQYLRDGFIPHPVDIQTSAQLRALAKWFFDFVKNAITVGALMALGKKTNSNLIELLAWLSFGVLNGYVLSYTQTWHFEPFHSFRNSRPRFAATGIIVWLIIIGVFILGVQYILMTAINAIVDSNTK
jgi:hypothetical protein